MTSKILNGRRGVVVVKKNHPTLTPIETSEEHLIVQ